MKNIFKIHFHPLFYLVVVIFIFTGHFHDFFLFLSIILFHELGHILGGIFFRWDIEEVLILPFGSLTIFKEGLNKPLKEEFFIAILGSLFQIIFYFLFKNKWDITSLHYSLLFFNLLPITPLDGSKILNVFFNKFFPFKKSNWLTIITSIIIVCVVFMISFFLFPFNFLLLLVFLFLVIKIWKEFQNHAIVFQKFLYDRYYFPRKYGKTKKIDEINVSKIYKDYYHLFYEQKKCYTEREILRKRFDFKGKL